MKGRCPRPLDERDADFKEHAAPSEVGPLEALCEERKGQIKAMVDFS